MKVLKNAWFERFAKKQNIDDRQLLEAVWRVEQGLMDADLGGGVLKLRVARREQGKSGGFRTVVLYRKAKRAIFVFGFSKNDRANITQAEKTQFKKAAAYVLDLTCRQLADLVDRGYFSEVSHDGKELQE